MLLPIQRNLLATCLPFERDAFKLTRVSWCRYCFGRIFATSSPTWLQNALAAARHREFLNGLENLIVGELLELPIVIAERMKVRRLAEADDAIRLPR
jgi:hypothetical protein